jgi:predicted ATP-grasp superfamily ATP-dependent carboligase
LGIYLDILIYEHASAGGFAEGAVSPSILAEGFGMLRSLIAGLRVAGHRVTVIVAAELARFNPPLHADCTIPVFSFHEAQQAILRACAKIEAVYIIAPETGGTLQSLVEFVEQNGVPTLNCRSKAIQAVSNKAALNEALSSKDLKVPKTVMLDVSDSIKEVVESRFSFPVVFKPLDGVGCSGLSLVEDESQVVNAVAKIDAELASEKFVVQEYVEGEAVSVSLLCTGSSVLPVSLNKQEINLSGPEEASGYVGGCVPYDHELRKEAFEVAEAVVGCFSGLRGYVGVDLILTKKGPVVVDVNPRLTTSFVGLSRVASFNFADSLVNAALKGELPTTAAFGGFAVFSKVETVKPDVVALERLFAISGVVSPPFPILDSDSACAFVSGEGSSIDIASLRLEEAKKNVLESV